MVTGHHYSLDRNYLFETIVVVCNHYLEKNILIWVRYSSPNNLFLLNFHLVHYLLETFEVLASAIHRNVVHLSKYLTFILKSLNKKYLIKFMKYHISCRFKKTRILTLSFCREEYHLKYSQIKATKILNSFTNTSFMFQSY